MNMYKFSYVICINCENNSQVHKYSSNNTIPEISNLVVPLKDVRGLHVYVMCMNLLGIQYPSNIV